ncbi:hypothetical protein CJ030_MR0G003718 [Morella rubra]|uniref:Uncharacterized protein n=1 Tax=Morella rubra TaxID=262757 RepID=A0A6A1UNF6_9ROSI|nr:hypothetical protein CJ030_MR0G003718 [Morella rubra]
MGLLSPKNTARTPNHLLPTVTALAVFSVTAIFLYKVDDFAFQTKTVAGHNLDPTPWHPFPPKNFGEQTRQALAHKIIYCSYLSCHSGTRAGSSLRQLPNAPP